MDNLKEELKVIIEHRMTTLAAFASISLYANIFIIISMISDNPENKWVYMLVNIVPLEFFIFIEGNLFLTKYIQNQSDASILRGHFWAFICGAWWLLFWVFLPPLSIIFMCWYNDWDTLARRTKASKIVNIVLIITSIITFFSTVTVTRFLSSSEWTKVGIIWYLLYVACWVYIILFISFSW